MSGCGCVVHVLLLVFTDVYWIGSIYWMTEINFVSLVLMSIQHCALHSIQLLQLQRSSLPTLFIGLQSGKRIFALKSRILSLALPCRVSCSEVRASIPPSHLLRIGALVVSSSPRGESMRKMADFVTGASLTRS